MTNRNELTPFLVLRNIYLSGLLARNQEGGRIVSEANAFL